ncbi:MAG: aldehyde dehydrogenase family protein [Thiotrichales bacterium]|jgi:acyl-CoA reductase-like NAD-dependent aldehyde dehydrogenase|nr:aldehyde dehydrogenase family protein [Thiotrichales bacterium]MBT3613308.1 aldehyde dehydrogenase family protein [Thiotrichales bacterium]MBT3751787.1 aldehyde dehydrogenase family protein [Thiotrichales bacterium]MBT3838082.1 aldehyde dehydrogenase family protein [Thiotrichales bacterium]MBT4152119.1 aldehyde dehydrogenase family protein [Thiotrichales bacterium]
MPVKHFKNMVAHTHQDGREESGHSVEVVAPYDQQLIATVAQSDADEIELALDTAYQLYRDRENWLSKSERIEILRRVVLLMGEQADELALEAAREGGKPLMDSKVEVARAIDSIQIAIDCLRTESGQSIPMGINPASADKLAFTTHEPIGVVVAVSAFNHPLNLIAHQVGPAIAAGCPVIVKPAEVTPLSCLRFVKIVREAGLPEAWCQALLPQSRELSTKLVSDSRVAFLSFIGSAKVGWMLRSKLAPGARCALEHGGVAPVIIAEDADIEKAIPKLLKGGFYHAGQVCVSVQRIYAHESIAIKLAQTLAVEAKKIIIGDPTEAKTEVGPLIKPAEVARISSWVQEAIAEGAKLLCGGEAISVDGVETSYACTVLYNPSVNSKVSSQEIFGPVICIYPYSDIDEAVTQANALSFSFQAACFTESIERANYLYRNLDASAVMVNDHTAFRVDWMPFAGLRESGLGVGGIPYTLRDMQVEKMLVINN